MAALIDDNAVHAVFSHPLADGAFETPVRDYLRLLGARRPLLLLAFAPKAAGTYFRQAAIQALGGQLLRLCHAQGGRDGTLYLPNVLAACLDDDAPASVSHIHMQALAANRNFIDAVGFRPVIMIRDIADMLASFLDMLEADPVARAEGLNCQVPAGFCALDRAAKLDFMIDVIAPWYASYFATWKSYADEMPGTVCVLHYRDFCRDPAQSLHAAITHAGFAASRAACAEALEQVWEARQNYRYNKGVAGRGRDCFAPAQLERLHRLLSYYPQLQPWMGDLLGPALTQAEARPRPALPARSHAPYRKTRMMPG